MTENIKVGDSVYLKGDYKQSSHTSRGSSKATHIKVYEIREIDDLFLKLKDPDNPFVDITATVDQIVRVPVEESKTKGKAKGGRRLVRTRRRSKRRAGTRRRRA
jgi:hypothetical protein